MKAGEIQVELSQTNRWWRGPGWEREDPDLQVAGAAPFDYRPSPLGDLAEGGLYLLRGPRRVGKSTEVKRAIAALVNGGLESRRVVWASVDGRRAEDLRRLVSAARVHLSPPEAGPRYWFIDEITGVSGDWPSEIKWLRDNDPFGTDTVVLTGSSSARIDGATKALAGRRGNARNSDRVLLPMRFSDFCAATGLAHPPGLPGPIRACDVTGEPGRGAMRAAMPWLADLLIAWEVYLRVGGYPQAVAGWARDRDVPPSLVDALWQVVHGEAITAAGFSHNQTAALLATVARGLCAPLSISSLSRDVDVARSTASERVSDLDRAYITWPLHREENLHPKLRAGTKRYFIDPLLARLAHLHTGSREPDPSQINEQQIGVALLRNLERHKPTGLTAYDRLLYYRSATGAEIDFVGKDLAGLAVECKYVDDRWGREMQTIAASPWFGVLATRSGADERPEGLAVPSPILSLLLDG